MANGYGSMNRIRETMPGTILFPTDPGYEQARRPWNLSVEQRPIAVAIPTDVSAVQAIVRAAIADGLRVTTQPNGHGAAGDLDGVVLLRPSRLDEVSVDIDRRVLRVGPGVNWGRALEHLKGTGLIALAGSNPEVNVIGLALNGGHSMFSRRLGLTATSVLAVDLVDGRGQLRHVTEQSDPELMWALRGGGGLFGVVVRMELALYPGPSLYGGTLAFPEECALDVLTEAVRLADDERDLGVDLGLASFPDLPFVAEPMRGKRVVSVGLVHVGDQAHGHRCAERLRAVSEPIADSLDAFSIETLSRVAAEPTEPLPLADFGSAIRQLDEEFLLALIRAFREGADAGLTRLGIRLLGGQIAKGNGRPAIAGRVSAPGMLSAQVLLNGQIDPSRALAPLRALADVYGARGGIPSLLGHGAPLTEAFDSEALRRLNEVVGLVNPDNVLVGNRLVS